MGISSKFKPIHFVHCLDNILDYWYVSQGKISVPSIDDKEDMMYANEAFDILGFSQTEKYNGKFLSFLNIVILWNSEKLLSSSSSTYNYSHCATY